METLASICIGLGLAAACGFRVFLPLLALSVAARAGMVDLGSGTAWIATWPAIVALSTATVLEIGGYYIPWIDHALDVVATPAAVIAGALVAASQFGDIDPLMKWSAALVAGGGLAAVAQTATVGVRAASTATTGGVANPIVSTVETGIAALLSGLTMIAPLLAGLVLLIVGVILVRWVSRRWVASTATRPILPSRARTIAV